MGNIYDIGSLRSINYPFKSPVEPVKTTVMIRELLERDNVPKVMGSVFDFVYDNGRHQGISIEENGMRVAWKGRWGVWITVAASNKKPDLKITTSNRVEVKKALRKLGDGFYDASPIVGILNTVGDDWYLVSDECFVLRDCTNNLYFTLKAVKV